MKAISKLFTVITNGIIALCILGGCTKEKIYYYKYEGLEELEYIVGEESTTRAFFSSLNNVMDRFDGTNFTDSEIKSAVQNVVDDYNYGVIQGTFYLQKSTDKNSGYSTVKSYTLTFSSNNSGGGGNGGSNSNPLDFDFYSGFDYQGFWEPAINEGNGTYERTIYLGFGVNSSVNLYSRGITELAIGVQSLDGSIFQKTGWHDNVYVTKQGNTYWYTAIITDDYTTSWGTTVFFQHLSSATIKLKWTYRVKYNGSYYFEGERWTTETYPGTPY